MIRMVLVDAPPEVQGEHIELIASGAVAVVSAADFPTKDEKYPADIVSRLTEDHEKHCPVCEGQERSRMTPEKRKPHDVLGNPAVNDVLRRVLKRQ